MANQIPVCVGGNLWIDGVTDSIKCDGTLAIQETSTALESPITIAEHIELAWLVVLVLIAGASAKYIIRILNK